MATLSKSPVSLLFSCSFSSLLSPTSAISSSRFSLPAIDRYVCEGGDNGWSCIDCSFMFPEQTEIILGPSVFGWNFSFGEYIFPDRRLAIIEMLTTFGVMCFLFTTGVKMDPAIMFQPWSHRDSNWHIDMLVLDDPHDRTGNIYYDPSPCNRHLAKSLPYIASSHSLTGFPVVSGLPSELHLLNSKLCCLAIPAAMFYDVM